MGQIEMIAGLRFMGSGTAMKVTIMHATVALVTRLLILILFFTDALTNQARAIILAVDCLVFGLLGLVPALP